MPGAKRRALKKLLNGNKDKEAVSEPSSSASASDAALPPRASADSARSALSARSTHSTSSASPASAHSSPKPPSPVLPVLNHGLWGGGGAPRGGKKSSKQRFAERQARKKQSILDAAPPTDPAWNAQLEKERQEEIAVISQACDTLGANIFEIQPDGHCMYAAVADQLGLLGILPAHQSNNPYHTRRVAATYLRQHQDDFLPFLPSVDGEDMPGATDDGLMTPEQYGEYCHRVEGTAEWGGEPEIQALSRAFSIPIHVIQRGPPTVVSHGGENDAFGGATSPEESAKAGARVVRISYHRRMYGLGEHYNSLRPAT
ncbi:OTU domain-containing protein 2 [Vanrija pseudolonga]|uniref:OTU domain-containing protein 2 n=1 Tax=Vanrija pseudolonga TaxID=143232 RepID=A0AAF0Y418_9TREE|nr:OTU domain-containing protein 2 [Vanrija pseudolonga]